MNCTKAERLLTENPRSAETADLSRHLDECPRCKQLYQDLKALAELSGELKNDVQAPPAFFASRVCARAANPARPRRSFTVAVLATSVIGVFSFALVRFALPSETLVQTATPSVGATVSVAEDQAVEPQWTTDWPVQEPSMSRQRDRDSRYVEILVSEPSDSDFIVRLPSSIEVRSNQADNEYYLRNVSH